MKTLFSKHNTIRALLFVAAVTLIIWLFPRKNGYYYHFEMGKPWAYSLLTAPSDMPIYLDSVRARQVKDSIAQNFIPVYTRDVALEKSTLNEYATHISDATDLEITPKDRNKLINSLRSLLENGIVDQDTYHKIQEGKLDDVRFIHDNRVIVIPTSSYLSARAAYAYLDSVYSEPHFRTAIEKSGMSHYLVPTVKLDTVASNRLYEEVLQKAMAPIGVIQQGERIIDKGDVVTPELYTLLMTYNKIAAKQSLTQVDAHHYPIIGQALYVIILFVAMYLFLYLFRNRTFSNTRAMVFIMCIITAFVLFSYAMSETFANGLFMVPFTAVVIMMVVFFDGRTAFLIYTILIAMCMMLANFPLEFVYVQLIAGITAITSLKELNKRSQLVSSAIYIFISYCLAYTTVEVMQTGTIDKINTRMFGCFGINAVLISFTYVLVFVIEKLFGFVSSVTLVELSDVNNPLLRELSQECPGTFQHSMQVSNLASDAAHRIGANVQLVRTGALYHDIGKINNPAFFTENQHGVNPHDLLTPIQSAQIVINHVTDGLKKAEKMGLPAVIKAFITEHHGSGKAKYFYNTYCNAHPGEEVDETLFTYPGPNPQTKETSLLMMADAVEAASRSLKEPTTEAITELVNRLIDTQIKEGLHNDSPLSFRDVKKIKDAFIERLRTMYHARISYPEMKKSPDTNTNTIPE